ncbi:MAG: hypothetical protein ACRDT0_10845 [Pseudonocardiaceae bacterium]
MDEQRLGELFRDAVGTSPAASFDRDDVLAASRRATARRRSALAGGSLLGIAVLAGGVVVGGQLLGSPGTSETPAAAPAPPETGRRMLEPVPPVSTLGVPPGPDAAGNCGPADPALGAELTETLAGRDAAPGGPAVPLPETCPPGSRAAGVPVPGGTLYLVLAPPTPGVGDSGTARPDGARGHATSTASGKRLAVLSVPAAAGQPAPLGDDVDELASELAARF